MEEENVEENDPMTKEILERTAAWVKEVTTMKVEPMETETKETEDSVKAKKVYKEATNGDTTTADNGLDQNDHDNNEQFGTLYNELFRDQLDARTVTRELDIPTTVKEFKDVCEKLGISQRFAAKHIMEKTSQGNLSFLLDKGRHKKWNELSPRGRIPYIRMRRWLDSDSEKELTASLLTKTKEYKKTGPKDGGCRREKFTIFQLMVLCRFFEEDPNPNQTTRTLLAEKLDASLERITIWFQNQRARGFPAQRILSQSNFTRKSVDIQNMVNLPLPNLIGQQGECVPEFTQSNLQFPLTGSQSNSSTQSVWKSEVTSPRDQPISTPVAGHSKQTNQSNARSQLNFGNFSEMEQRYMEAYYNEMKMHFPVQNHLNIHNMTGRVDNEVENGRSTTNLFSQNKNTDGNGTVCEKEDSSLEAIRVNTVAAHSKTISQSNSTSGMRDKNGVQKTNTDSLYKEFNMQRSEESDDDQPINFSLSNKES